MRYSSDEVTEILLVKQRKTKFIQLNYSETLILFIRIYYIILFLAISSIAVAVSPPSPLRMKRNTSTREIIFKCQIPLSSHWFSRHETLRNWKCTVYSYVYYSASGGILINDYSIEKLMILAVLNIKIWDYVLSYYECLILSNLEVGKRTENRFK